MEFNQVSLIDIEIHNLCNRKCEWCPTRFLDFQKAKQLPLSIYTDLLYELKHVNYRGSLLYSRHSEPMYDLELLEQYTRLAQRILPDVKLIASTNGDYLCSSSLILITNGSIVLNELHIMDYDDRGLEAGVSRLRSLGCSIDKVKDSVVFATLGELNLLYFADWSQNANIQDRGGLLDLENKKLCQSPCLEPTRYIGIDHTGDVMPCSNLISSHYDHKPYVLGNLHKHSLEEIFSAPSSELFRGIAANIDKTMSSIAIPCIFCTAPQ